MPREKFTKSSIDRIQFSDKGQVIYWDTDTPGLGLVVGTKTKTFRLQLDVKDATMPKGYRTIKKTLGRYGTDITLEQAKDMIRGRVDKDTGEAVLGERIKLKLADTPPSAGENVTLGELVAEYFRETKRSDGKARRESSAILYKSLIERHYAEWLDMSLKDVNIITPDVVMEKFQQLAIKGAQTAKNGVIMLSAVLKYGCAKYPGALKSNPMAILTNRYINVMPKIEARHECLIYDAEKRRNDFKTLFDGMQNMHEVRRDLLLFTLYTGLRKTESSSLEWSSVNIEHKELFIPDTKNRQDLHIPLNRQAMVILNRRKEQAVEGNKWVFPATIASKHGYASARPNELRKMTGLQLTVHALRRTFITVGRKLKRYEDTDCLTNHIDSSMAGRHYYETSIEDLRETCQMIGNEIERRMLAETAKVIGFPAARQTA